MNISLRFILPALLLASAAGATERWTLRCDAPAEKWEDALVTGNGSHGTMVMGRTDAERITMVHEELFHRNWDRSIIGVPDIAEHLPEMRKRIAEGNNNTAMFVNTHAREQTKAMGADEVWECMPHPAFDLNIDHAAAGPAQSYRNQLNLETGEALCAWKKAGGGVEQRVFSSRIDDVNVVQLRAPQGEVLNLTLSLNETPGRRGTHCSFDLDSVFRSVESSAEPGWLSYHADYEKDRSGYEGLARVTHRGGRMIVKGVALEIIGAEEVLILVRVTPLKDGSETRVTEVKETLEGLSTDYADLLDPHAAEHGEMFRRVQLDLGAAEAWTKTTSSELLKEVDANGPNPMYLEMVHAMGRYLLISSSGKYPPPLMGIWGGDWKAAWAGGFVLDTNLYLATSAAGMGNLPECVESYASYIEGMLDGWRINASRTLGTRGFLAGNYSNPETGYMTHKNPFCWYYICQAGWHLRPLYDYALLTGDWTFMEKRVWPLYLEMADFYEDYLVEDADGVRHITPSCSPENVVLAPNGKRSQLADDSTVDIAVAREVYQFLMNMGERFDVDPERIAEWQRIHDSIAPYRINAEGALAEWAPAKYTEETYNHRHNSHLYPIFPGYEFFMPGADPRLKEAAEVALGKRIEHAQLGDGPGLSAHGVVFAAQMASRLRKVDYVQALLEHLVGKRFHYQSAVTSHCPNGRFYNLDLALSYPRLLMEMLVFSHPGHIDLMPGWYEGLPDGTISGVLIRGGHQIDLHWASGNIRSARLQAGADETLTIHLGEQSHKLKVEAGQQYELTDLFSSDRIPAIN